MAFTTDIFTIGDINLTVSNIDYTEKVQSGSQWRLEVYMVSGTMHQSSAQTKAEIDALQVAFTNGGEVDVIEDF